MLIYVAVLTKFVISVVRISLAASSVSFSFLSPRHRFFPLTYVGIAIVSTILFSTLCIT